MKPDDVRSWIETEAVLDWDRVLSNVLQAFDCTTGTLHLWDDEQNLLLLRAERGVPGFLLPKMNAIPIGKGMAGVAAERRAPVQICNLQTDASGVARPSAKETKVEGSLAAPLIYEGHLYGTLGIAKPVPYEFSDGEIDALMDIGRAICIRLHAERLQEGTAARE